MARLLGKAARQGCRARLPDVSNSGKNSFLTLTLRFHALVTSGIKFFGFGSEKSISLVGKRGRPKTRMQHMQISSQKERKSACAESAKWSPHWSADVVQFTLVLVFFIVVPSTM
jgi:hypothetical protein